MEAKASHRSPDGIREDVKPRFLVAKHGLPHDTAIRSYPFRGMRE